MTALPAAVLNTSERCFLGVERSASGRAWRDRLDARGQARALTIAQRHGLPELLARVLAGRGVEADEVEAFLDPTIKRLMPDPHTLTDMEAAAARLAHAAIEGKASRSSATTTSTARPPRRCCAVICGTAGSTRWCISRTGYFEGYGPNAEAIRAFAETRREAPGDRRLRHHQPAPLRRARRARPRCRRLDHHSGGRGATAGVRWSIRTAPDDLSGLGHLAAVGLTFCSLVALNARTPRTRLLDTARRREPDLLSLLDSGRARHRGDVVPLIGLNRAFVAKGLLAMRRREHLGLTALMDAARLGGPPKPWHLGFLLGPRINAGGRIGRARSACDCCSRATRRRPSASPRTRPAQPRTPADRSRRRWPRRTPRHCRARAREKGAVVVTAGQGWHPGVVGLVAARLKERSTGRRLRSR